MLLTGQSAGRYGQRCERISTSSGLVQGRFGRERHLAVGVVRVPGEPRSFPLVGPCEVRKEGSQRLEGLRVVIAGRASHVRIQQRPTRCRDLVRVHGIHLQVGISSGGPALIDALIVRSCAATRFRGTTYLRT